MTPTIAPAQLLADTEPCPACRRADLVIESRNEEAAVALAACPQCRTLVAIDLDWRPPAEVQDRGYAPVVDGDQPNVPRGHI